MAETVSILIDGEVRVVTSGTTVAAAILNARVVGFRRSVRGGVRSPLCGMGVCYECRVTVDGLVHSRSCQIVCREGMEVCTDG